MFASIHAALLETVGWITSKILLAVQCSYEF